MNKYTELLKAILSVSSILKVLAPLAKKKCLVWKEQTNKNQFEQNPLSKEKNSTCKNLILAYYKLFIAENVIVSLRRQ